VVNFLDKQVWEGRIKRGSQGAKPLDHLAASEFQNVKGKIEKEICHFTIAEHSEAYLDLSLRPHGDSWTKMIRGGLLFKPKFNRYSLRKAIFPLILLSASPELVEGLRALPRILGNIENHASRQARRIRLPYCSSLSRI